MYDRTILPCIWFSRALLCGVVGGHELLPSVLWSRALSFLLTVYLFVFSPHKTPHINILHCYRSFCFVHNLPLIRTLIFSLQHIWATSRFSHEYFSLTTNKKHYSRSSEGPWVFSSTHGVVFNLELFHISHTVPLLLGDGLSNPFSKVFFWPGLHVREVVHMIDCWLYSCINSLMEDSMPFSKLPTLDLAFILK